MELPERNKLSGFHCKITTDKLTEANLQWPNPALNTGGLRNPGEPNLVYNGNYKGMQIMIGDNVKCI